MLFVAQSMKKRIPNLITLMRIVIAAMFFVTLLGYQYPDHGRVWGNIAIGLFILGAFTDFIDGYLARKWDVVSLFGRIMDPFCDKVLIIGAFICFAGPRFIIPESNGEYAIVMATGVYPWMVILLIARELLVTAIRDVLESRGYSGGAKWAGKLKMIVQSVAIPAILLITVNLNPNENSEWLYTNQCLVWLVIIITLWSGIPYVTGLVKVMRQNNV